MSVLARKAELAKVAAAFGHSARIEILEAAVATDEPISPVMLSELLDAPVNRISYHTHQLAAAGLLLLVEEVPRRGAVEHLYRPELGVEQALALLREAEKALG